MTYSDQLTGQEDSRNFNKVYAEMPSKTTDKLDLARTLFDLKEYLKAAHTLIGVEG